MITTKKLYLTEEEFYEKWELKFMKLFREFCPESLVDEESEEKTYQNWLISRGYLFYAPTVLCDETFQYLRDISMLQNMYGEGNYRAEIFILESLIQKHYKHYTEEEMDNICSFLYEVIDRYRGY